MNDHWEDLEISKLLSYEETHKVENNMLYKLCNICDQWLPCNEEYFHRNKSNKSDGLYPCCKKCNIKKTKQWAKDNKEQHNEYNRKAFKENRWNIVTIRREGSIKRRENGKHQEWVKNNPEKIKQYLLNHRNHDISDQEWIACKEYFDNSCAYCGLPIEENYRIYDGKSQKIDFHKEHVDDNGANDLSNCVPACKSCNSSKWAFTLEEWYREQEYFSEEKFTKIYFWCNEEYKKYIEDKLPYRIIRKRNEEITTFHWELWSVDEKRNIIECVAVRDKKKEILEDLKNNKIKI